MMPTDPQARAAAGITLMKTQRREGSITEESVGDSIPKAGEGEPRINIQNIKITQKAKQRNQQPKRKNKKWAKSSRKREA